MPARSPELLRMCTGARPIPNLSALSLLAGFAYMGLNSFVKLPELPERAWPRVLVGACENRVGVGIAPAPMTSGRGRGTAAGSS